MDTRYNLMALKAALLPLGAASVIAACNASDEVESTTFEESVLTATPEGVSAEDDCKKVNAWLEANRDTLPLSYDKIIQFPIQYRRAIVSVHSPVAKSVLWRAHFNQYMRQHPSLTPGQQTVVERAIGQVSPEFFAVDKDSPDWSKTIDAPLRALRQQAEEALGFEEARALLETFGPVDPAIVEAMLGASPKEAANTSAKPLLAECPCSTSSDWCTSPAKCKYQYWSCTITPFGCGSVGVYSCNGWCIQGNP